MEIPQQLQATDMRFVIIHPNEKRPKGEEWNIIGGSNYSLKEIQEYLIKNPTFNYGFLCGYGNYLVVDIDRKDEKVFSMVFEQAKHLPKTFTVTTRSGGEHLYYKIKNPEKAKFVNLKCGDKDAGEIRWITDKGTFCQVLCPGSQIDGNYYKEHLDNPITEIDFEEIQKILIAFIPTRETQELNTENTFDVSIKDVFDLKGMNQYGQELYGEHPVHGSDSGKNFWVNLEKNTWFCFRHHVGGSAIQLYAVLNGFCKCEDVKELRGAKFVEVVKSLEKKLGKKILKEQQVIELEDVPTLKLVDFSKYRPVFENTHEHLYGYKLVESEMGLIGEEYYPLKKAMNYMVESLKQPTISFYVGNEMFDNRIHILLQGGAGTGKGKCKNIIRKRDDVVECAGARTNLEQLIGKKVMIKGEEHDILGYFGYKGLVLDEAQSLLCEEDKNLSSIMREIRLAMDIYGSNKTDKKLVNNEEPMSYYPETRFMILIHETIYPPVFFDTGTFRRTFAFDLRQTKIKEMETIANLYKTSSEKQLVEYLTEKQLWEQKRLVFEKQTIDEIVDWFLMWNKFVFLNPNQRVRAVSKGLVFSGKVYFFRLTAILALMRNETIVSVETARLACRDTIHFLLKTIEVYGNRSMPTLSRDVWKSSVQQDCMLFEWLHYNKAVSRDKSVISIKDTQDKIQDFFGVQEKQARRIYLDMKKRGYLEDWKGQHESKCWLGFEPQIDCPIDFEQGEFPDLGVWISGQMVKPILKSNGTETSTNNETSQRGHGTEEFSTLMVRKPIVNNNNFNIEPNNLKKPMSDGSAGGSEGISGSVASAIEGLGRRDGEQAVVDEACLGRVCEGCHYAQAVEVFEYFGHDKWLCVDCLVRAKKFLAERDLERD